ncbi:MAG: LD-carboxypeptidase [Planctomycetes bacterium]|nr:LD-carboxypeptidase [Planctomycetota bacterium]
MPDARSPAVLRPPRLRRGDRVAVVSPAGPLTERRRTDLDRGLERLRRQGLVPELSRHALGEQGFLSGSDAQRADDLQRAFAEERIRAVFCTRGGYGVTRLLDRLDFAPLRSDPKPIVGYSDVTALLAAAFRRVGLVGLHGPMVATSDSMAMGDAMEELQRRLLSEADRPPPLPRAGLGPKPRVLRPGRAEGRLVGGNLTLVCALIGTPDQIDTNGNLLLLEDVDEAPYRIDRMLTQLRATGALDRCAGVLLGDFHREDSALASVDPDTQAVLEERLGDLRVPVVTGLPFGHRPASWTLPIGGLARVDASSPLDPPRVELLEPAVR